MERQPVESSAVVSVGYDAETKTLEIEYVHGRVYQYFFVPKAVHEALMTADSIGEYVNRVIKPVYTAFQEVDG